MNRLQQSYRSDRRTRRSVYLLKQAFREVVDEKGFEAVTIQDITDRADVNRGTFYAHFPDKYTLLDTIIRDKFQWLLAQGLPDNAGWNREHLAAVIQVTLRHFEDVHGNCQRKETLSPLYEQVVQQELAALFNNWLTNSNNVQWQSPLPASAAATMISWAIFGLANEWSKLRQAPSVDEVTEYVLEFIENGTSRLDLSTRTKQ